MPSFTETTAELLRAGGRSAVPIDLPTSFSDASSSFQKIAAEQYTCDMSQVCRTLLMLLCMASTPPAPSCSTQLSFSVKSDLSSLTSDPRELARKGAFKHLGRAQDLGADALDGELRATKLCKVPEARVQRLLIPPPNTPTAKGPAPYPQHLTPAPLHLQPHCLTKDRLRQWAPASLPPQPAGASMTSEAEWEHMKDMMLHTWEEDTHMVYRAGLLMWHCFCDKKGTPEEARAPVAQSLLSAFVAHLAAAYSGRTILGYLNGV
jgi:hypothetical protein